MFCPTGILELVAELEDIGNHNRMSVGLVPLHISISLPNNEQVFDDKSIGEGWQNDPLGNL